MDEKYFLTVAATYSTVDNFIYCKRNETSELDSSGFCYDQALLRARYINVDL